MKFDKAFFSQFALVGIQVLFFTLLFRHLGSLYTKLIYTPGNLDNLTPESALEIESTIRENLQDAGLKNSLYRYFVFFYLDDYTSRQYFISSSGEAPAVQNQKTADDPFYPPMLTYHLNNICYIINSENINKESDVYKRLSSTGEITPTTFYVSCPIFIDDVLVGYIGGLNNKEDGSISIETAAVRNAARNVGTILSKQ